MNHLREQWAKTAAGTFTLTFEPTLLNDRGAWYGFGDKGDANGYPSSEYGWGAAFSFKTLQDTHIVYVSKPGTSEQKQCNVKIQWSGWDYGQAIRHGYIDCTGTTLSGALKAVAAHMTEKGWCRLLECSSISAKVPSMDSLPWPNEF